MLRRLWLVFAQAVTVVLAVAFTFATLRPEWLPQALRDEAEAPRAVVPFEPSLPPSAPPPIKDSGAAAQATFSYSVGAQRATAAVVNIFTSKTIRGGDRPLF